MSHAEIELFEAVVRKSNRYLEFGLGGSSLVAVRANVKTIVSVDSDPKWVAAVRQHPEVKSRIADGTMSVLHADIGPVRDWGNPIDREHIEKWPRYLSTAWSEWIRRGEFPDLVLVDGRFRVACCLSIVLAAAREPGNAPTVLIHDFTQERPQYMEVLKLYDIKEQVEGLYHLQIRSNACGMDALVRLLNRQFDHG